MGWGSCPYVVILEGTHICSQLHLNTMRAYTSASLREKSLSPRGWTEPFTVETLPPHSLLSQKHLAEAASPFRRDLDIPGWPSTVARVTLNFILESTALYYKCELLCWVYVVLRVMNRWFRTASTWRLSGEEH